MSEITWTEEELEEFNRLSWLAASRNQMDRIHARTGMPAFIERHGKEKCDAMWAHIQANEKS